MTIQLHHHMTKRILSTLVGVSSLIAAAATANAAILIFTDKCEFLTATAATNCTGELPNLGLVSGGASASFQTGQVTFSIAAPAWNLYSGAPAPCLDWTALLPGPDIAVSGTTETLNAAFASTVFSAGFDFAEPTRSGCGTDAYAPFSNSTFRVTLKLGVTNVASFIFDAPNDVAAFVGVQSDAAFDRMEIREIGGAGEDEYFGQFYCGTIPLRIDPRSIDLPFIHSGARDPLLEGWSLANPAPDFAILGPVADDLGAGIDAWHVEDLGTTWPQLVSYGMVLSPEQVVEANHRGWSLTAKLRVLGTNTLSDEDFCHSGWAPGIGYVDGLKNWAVGMDRTPTDDLIVAAVHRPDLVRRIPGAGGGYHTYKMAYDASSQTASLYVDGQFQFTWQGTNYTATPRVSWGCPSTPDTGGGHFSEVVFDLNRPLLSIQVGCVDIFWDTLTNKTYQVESRSELTNAWTPLGPPVPGTGSRICITDSVRGQPTKFYRVVLLP